MAETIVLDPASVAAGRTQLDITGWVAAAGPDWGDAAIEAYMANQAVGSSPVDYRLPNRQVRIPLNLRQVGGTSFASIRSSLQQKAALFQREGGQVMREVDTTPLYGDVVGATLHLGGSLFQAYRSFDLDAVLTLECLPDFYGDEVALDSITATGGVAAVLTSGGSSALIKGNHPARTRVIVTDTSGNDHRGLIAALRSRYYSSDAHARLGYDATQVQAAVGSTRGAMSTASSGQAISQSLLPPSWTTVLTTDLSDGPLNHRGTYRAMARLYTTVGPDQGQTTSVQLAWSVAGNSSLVTNKAWAFPGANAWYLVDLGLVHLDAAPVDTHYWRGYLQALGVSGVGRDVYFDKLWLVPVDEGFAKLSVPQIVTTSTNPYVAQDDFQTLGSGVALNGRVAPLGGTWTTSAGGAGGSTTDFVGDVSGSDVRVRRSTTDDGTSGVLQGRLALTSATYTETEVGGDLYFDGLPSSDGTFGPGIVARYVDANNFLVFGYARLFGIAMVAISMASGGTATWLNSTSITPVTNIWLTATLRVQANGSVFAAVYIRGQGSPLWTLSAQHNALATGGTLASGQAGFRDFNSSGQTVNRYYDNAWSRDPTSTNPQSILRDGVVLGNRRMESRWDGHYRQDAAGLGSARLGGVGDYLRLPPSGMEARPVELLVRPSRGDLDEMPDSGLDGFSVQVRYRPSFLYVAD